MKGNLTRLIKITCLLLPVILVMLLLPFRTSDNLIRIRDYYREEEDSLDVVFLGASEVFAGLSSGLAYGEYGYTSYPYSVSANYVDFYKYQLDEIYRTQSPQWVVMDLSSAVRPEAPDNLDAIFREYIEKVPLSRNKIRAIRDLGDREHQLSYYIPFMMYHGSEDAGTVLSIMKDELLAMQRGYAYLKGTSTSTALTLEGELLTPTPQQLEKKEALPGSAEPKLREVLEYCREKGYDNILFITLPHRIASDYGVYRIQLYNTLGDLVESYGYDFVNLELASDRMGIDQNQDYYNNDHLNIYGQQKVTRYLSELLIRDCGLEPRQQTRENQARWENSYDYYLRYYAYADRLAREEPGVNHTIWEEDWRIEAIRDQALPGVK